MLNIYTFKSLVRSVKTADLFCVISPIFVYFQNILLFFYTSSAILKLMISS